MNVTYEIPEEVKIELAAKAAGMQNLMHKDTAHILNERMKKDAELLDAKPLGEATDGKKTLEKVVARARAQKARDEIARDANLRMWKPEQKLPENDESISKLH